jgi:glycosyltransferase involved in cell wall biosynthesis
VLGTTVTANKRVSREQPCDRMWDEARLAPPARMSSRPTSFLLICYSYPPVLGGSEIEAQRVCSALIRRGHKALVLCAGGAPLPPLKAWVDPAGVPVRILTRRAAWPWKDLLFAFRVPWLMWRERRNYQIAYFLMQGLQLITGLPVARALGKPIVMKIPGSSVIPLMERSLAGRLELRWLRKWAARILILNEGMSQEAVASGFPPEMTTWMPNPVDTDEFRPATTREKSELRLRYSIPEMDVVAVYVGRLAPEKGLQELVGGFAQAARCLPAARLILVGDGPSRGDIEALVHRLGVENLVRFAGRVKPSEVPCWLRASDVFCLTSPNEGFSCALVEAMAVGLPSVVSRIPGNVQLVEDGVHGHTAPLEQEAAVAEGMAHLLGDACARSRMGKAARRRTLERYSVAHVVERYENLFADVLRAHHAVRGGQYTAQQR